MNITVEPVPPTCPQCGTEMVLKTKGEDKFYGCPNYRECGAKTISYKTTQKDKPEVRRPEQPTRDLVLIEEIQALSKRFDDFEEGLTKTFEGFKKMLIIIEKKIDDK